MARVRPYVLRALMTLSENANLFTIGLGTVLAWGYHVAGNDDGVRGGLIILTIGLFWAIRERRD